MYDTTDKKEKYIMVAVATDADTGDQVTAEESLDEMEELLETAGAEVCGRVIQNLSQPNPGTYVGSGKLLEIQELIAETGATGIACDDELSPAQMKNLEDELGAVVLDRTLIILDIFAKRAVTKEGKVQVELAQLRYRSTRLIGSKNLSRTGGGIGTRGPGEKKLEVDRRRIRERISILKQDIREMENHREVTRRARSRNPVPVAAIVGYTNAGKSTLLNTLTDAGVLEEDKLFATLDPVTRSLTLPDGQAIMVTDTVGFIRKLPHHLIDAFRSTLEESKYADLLIHVVDSSNPRMGDQMHTVYDTLAKLEVGDKPVITVFNKSDLLPQPGNFHDFSADISLAASIKYDVGLDSLQEAISEILRRQRILIERVFPYEETGRVANIRKYGQLLEEKYTEEGIYVKAYVPPAFFTK